VRSRTAGVMKTLMRQNVRFLLHRGRRADMGAEPKAPLIRSVLDLMSHTADCLAYGRV
jgi:hypothetical protein